MNATLYACLSRVAIIVCRQHHDNCNGITEQYAMTLSNGTGHPLHTHALHHHLKNRLALKSRLNSFMSAIRRACCWTRVCLRDVRLRPTACLFLACLTTVCLSLATRGIYQLPAADAPTLQDTDLSCFAVLLPEQVIGAGATSGSMDAANLMKVSSDDVNRRRVSVCKRRRWTSEPQKAPQHTPRTSHHVGHVST